MTPQMTKTTPESNRTLKKALGAALCFLLAAWILTTPELLQAEQECSSYCQGTCVGVCVAAGMDCYWCMDLLGGCFGLCL